MDITLLDLTAFDLDLEEEGGGSVSDLIETYTPSGVSELDITLPSGYVGFILRGWILPANNGVNLRLRCNDGGGFDVTNEYSDSGFVVVSGGSTGGWGGNGIADICITRRSGSFQEVGNAANEGVRFKFDLHDALEAVYTGITGMTSYLDTSGDQATTFFGAHHNVAAALTELRFFFTSGNIASGRIYLIGVS